MIVLSVEEKIDRCIGRNPEWKDYRIARSVNCSVALVRARKLGMTLPQVEKTKTSLVSLTKVVERYDIKAAILQRLSEVPRGNLIIEADLCQKAAGTDRNRFRRTVENNNEEFKGLRIKLKLDDSSDGKWYWGHPDDITEAFRIKEL